MSASEFPNHNPELHDGAVFAMRAPCGLAEPEYPLEATPDFGATVAASLLEPTFERDAFDEREVVAVEAPPPDAIDIPVEHEPVAWPQEETIAHDASAHEEHEEDGGDDPPLWIEEATVIDAPVAYAIEGDELETVDLDAPIENDAAPASARDDDSSFEGWLRTAHALTTRGGLAVSIDALRSFVVSGWMDGAALSPASLDALQAGKVGGLHEGTLVATEAFRRVATEWRSILSGEGGDLSNCGARTLDEWSADWIARMIGAPQELHALQRELRLRGVAAFGFVAAA